MSIDPGSFAAVFAGLYAAHQVGDHWVQTHHQACGKGAPTWEGRALCFQHVVTLTATKAAVLGLVVTVCGMNLHPIAVVLALFVDAASHYWADRRSTLLALADKVGKGEYARLGDGKAAPVGTGAYSLDQSWHIGWLLVASLLACVGVSA